MLTMRRPPSEENASGDCLHGKFEVRSGAVKVVVHAEQEDERRGREDGEKCLQGEC
jgi:hypothetical protein